MYQLYGIDFIVYPSFATNNITCNIAFHPNFVDNHLRLVRVFRFRINDVNKIGGNYSIDKVGKVFWTNIKWDIPTDEDIKEHFPEARKVVKK